MAFIKETEDMKIEETFSVKQEDTEEQSKMAFIKETEDMKIEETFSVKQEDTEEQTKMPFIKETEDMKIEETFSVKQEDTEEQTKMPFIKETEDLRIEEAFRVMQEDTEEQTKIVFIKEGTEDLRIEETFSVKQEDTEEQTKMPFIKETEDMKIEETFSVKQEDTEEQTKMPFIKETEDMKIEETFSVKQEDTEEQTKMPFIKETEDLRIEEAFRVMQEDTEEQTKMVFIKERTEDLRIEETFSVKQEDTEEQTKMPFIKETEDMKIEETFCVKQEDTEEQTKMPFIKETEDMKIEETFSVKQEDTEEQTKMPFIKETEDLRIEETFSVMQEDTEEQTKMVFIEEGTEDLRIEETFSVKQKDTEEQKKMVFIKEGTEDLRIEETFSVKQEDTEEQTKMPFIKETEDLRIEEAFSVMQEDTEEQTKMVFIEEGTEDLRIEETFSVKQKDTEEQIKMVFIEEGTEDLRIEETFSVMQKNTETQRKMLLNKERSKNMKPEEKSRVKQDDTGTQTDCPLCLRGYHQLSQHLRLTHKVINSQERKLLLAISSGRVDVRKSTCPVPACGKSTSRIDRHLKDHTELTRAAQRETMQALKRKKIIDNLAELRASNPSVPMATTLDLEEAQDLMNAPSPPEEEEGGTCDNPRCQQAHKQLQDQVADLNRQVDMLSRALRYVTRRYQLLRRRSRSTPSTQVAQVTSKLLMALRSPEKKLEEEEGELHVRPSGELASQGPLDQPPTPQQSMQQLEEHPFPDHVAALNVLLEEYRGQKEGANPTPKLKNNIALKVFHIRHFIAYMAAGRSDLASLTFLNQTNRMRSWLNSLTQAKISKPTIHHYLKNITQFLDYLAETPPPTCHLSKVVLVGIRRQARMMVKLLQRKEKVQKVAFNPAKEGCLIPKAVLKECRSSAKQRIPEILAHLRFSGDKKDQWSFYGHLTAYLACIYGHRGGVFQNMTIKEVEEAQQTTTEGSYVINISSHMTNQAFGAAQLALDAEEYEWLQDFLSMRSTLVGGKDAYYFFFTSKPSSSKNLNQYFQEAWAGMGLPGTPTFTDVRTSIATHAKNTHSPRDWYKVAQFMCHDTSTADRFYVLNLNAKQAAEHRHLFESAVEGEKTTALKKVETWKRPTVSGPKGGKKPCKRTASSSTSASPSPSATPPQTKEGLRSRESASEGPSPAKRRLFSLKKMINLTPIKSKKNRELPQLSQEERDKVLKIVVTRLPGVFLDIMDYQ